MNAASRPFVGALCVMLEDMAHASAAPLGGFCCLHPSIITKAGEGNAVWSACSAKVSELLAKYPTRTGGAL